MSKAKKTEGASPEALGAAFACEQANVNGKLLKTLKETIGVFTVENKAEYEAMIEGYGTQAKSLYNANTAKVRKSEFKKICDHASTQETRNTLFNIIDKYESVQSLVKDLRGLESGSKVIDENGDVTKAPKDEGEIETGESDEITYTMTDDDKILNNLEIIQALCYDKGYKMASELILQAMAKINEKV
tara:strand:+ start:364 stop:927 length:564 start_codon:yes stop_codon:yes gene_type:complete